MRRPGIAAGPSRLSRGAVRRVLAPVVRSVTRSANYPLVPVRLAHPEPPTGPGAQRATDHGPEVHT